MYLNQIRDKKKDVMQLAKKYGADNIRIFGSVARGDATKESDVDFLVRFSSNRTLLDRIGFMQDLESLFGCKADVVNEKALHWYIRERILEEAIPL